MNPSKLTKFMVLAALFGAFASMQAAEQPKKSLVAQRAEVFSQQGAMQSPAKATEPARQTGSVAAKKAAFEVAPAKQSFTPASLQTIKTVSINPAVKSAAANYGKTPAVGVSAPAASAAQAQAPVSDDAQGFSSIEKTGYNPKAKPSFAGQRSRPTKKAFNHAQQTQPQVSVNAMTIVSAPMHEGLELQQVKVASGDPITLGTPRKQPAPKFVQPAPGIAVNSSNGFMEQLTRMAVCGGMSFVSSLTDKNWAKGVSELGQLAVVAHAAHQHKAAMPKQDNSSLLKKTMATAFLCQFAAQALSTQKGSLMSTEGLKKLVAFGLTKGALAWFTQIPASDRRQICEGILKQDLKFY